MVVLMIPARAFLQECFKAYIGSSKWSDLNFFLCSLTTCVHVRAYDVCIAMYATTYMWRSEDNSV